MYMYTYKYFIQKNRCVKLSTNREKIFFSIIFIKMLLFLAFCIKFNKAKTIGARVEYKVEIDTLFLSLALFLSLRQLLYFIFT